MCMTYMFLLLSCDDLEPLRAAEVSLYPISEPRGGWDQEIYEGIEPWMVRVAEFSPDCLPRAQDAAYVVPLSLLGSKVMRCGDTGELEQHFVRYKRVHIDSE